MVNLHQITLPTTTNYTTCNISEQKLTKKRKSADFTLGINAIKTDEFPQKKKKLNQTRILHQPKSSAALIVEGAKQQRMKRNIQ